MVDRRQITVGMAASLVVASDARAGDQGTKAGMESFTSGGLPIGVEWFPAGSGTGPAVLLLHGADGLTFAEGYRLAARVLASAGYHVGFVHYLDRTRDRRVVYSRIKQDYPTWMTVTRDAVSWIANHPGVDPARIGIVGVSLGAALAIDTAGADTRIKALVDYFGPVLDGVHGRVKRLPPTLILHGQMDGVVGIEHAHAFEAMLKRLGTPYEIKIYPDQGHGFIGAAQLDSAARVSAFLGRHLGAAARPG
ncbi:dienelactone hydrolase family protein [uncultured Enterovirga sp.]|uniref:dienelactone hydrolase family protein n=1 Tax=uncultured Enterovirga sp. TaxID=2026352 RepID=UPI0035C9FAE1